MQGRSRGRRSEGNNKRNRKAREKASKIRTNHSISRVTTRGRRKTSSRRAVHFEEVSLNSEILVWKYPFKVNNKIKNA